MRPVPVLMYHHVNPHKGDMVTITPETFEVQMKFLHDSGFRTLKADELIAYIHGKLNMDDKSVLITFDDGWLDNYIYAFPVLRKYGINAAIFIISDLVEKASASGPNTPSSVPTHKESGALIKQDKENLVALNWDMIKEMSDSGLVEFYSHTKSHRKCNSLTENELTEELLESKALIEKRLGNPCSYLCWPYGKYDDLAMEIARKSGYSGLFTTKHGIVKPGSDPFEIRRKVIKDDLSWFKRRMCVYTNPVLSEIFLKFKKDE